MPKVTEKSFQFVQNYRTLKSKFDYATSNETHLHIRYFNNHDHSVRFCHLNQHIYLSKLKKITQIQLSCSDQNLAIN